jgi:hypothetical protein
MRSMLIGLCCTGHEVPFLHCTISVSVSDFVTSVSLDIRRINRDYTYHGG